MPEERRPVTPWQRLTIYRYTLPPPYEATEYLFEELPLSTYPSGTTMEPLAYEMAPGAHLGSAVYPAFAMVAGMQLDGLLPISVAERSFSLLDRVKMCVKPMVQPLLHRSWQLQDKTYKTERLEDFKIASGIDDDMRPAATELLKGKCLTRPLNL
jgi:hypothetical protein